MSRTKLLSMIRSKKQIMYATIKGTLTENNGVFSGFSNSNYLQLQQNIELNNFEFAITFKTASDISSWSGFLLTNTSNNTFYIDFNYNRIIFRTTTAENTTDTYTWWQNLDTDTFYKLIWKYDISTTTHTYTLIKNNIIVATQTHSATFKGITDTFNLGQGSNVNSIDLLNSYIKLGSTKYNLQAVVGYTVVGSPTITDGVVSGFSGSDYLNILSPKSVPTEIKSDNMKIKIKIKTPQQWSTSNMFLIGYNHSVSSDSSILYDGGLYITTSGQLSIHSLIINSSQQPFMQLELDTIYYIETETKSVFKMGISKDNINWEYIQRDIYRDNWYLRNRNIRIGRAVTSVGQAFNGGIFINETSFVINNKLWFNGYYG